MWINIKTIYTKVVKITIQIIVIVEILFKENSYIMINFSNQKYARDQFRD